MKSSRRKIERFAASILIVFSLFVSTIAACCCDHYEEKAAVEVPSCHAQTAETKTENHHERKDSNETAQFNSIDANCECLAFSAPKVYAKNENVKAEKQALTSETVKLPEAEFAASIAAFESVFAAPFYLSDSFYNISPGRAPPRL